MMNWGLVLASVIVGFPLSWITARRAGRFWTEAKAIGGNLQVMVIASVIMAAVGFTGTYFIVLLSLAVTLQVLDEAIVKAVFPFLVGSAGMPVVGVMPALWLNGQVAR